MIALSEQIRRMRKDSGMTQDELAARCHCTRATIVNVETQHAVPSVKLLQRIALAFDCELALLPKNEAAESFSISRLSELEKENAEYRSIIRRIQKQIARVIA